MKFPAWQLQVALVSRIRSAAPEYPVHDEHPEPAIYPYITVGEVIARPWSDKLKSGQTALASFHFWSQYAGKQEVAEMMNKVLEALTTGDYPDLAPTFHVVLRVLDSMNIISDMDEATYHGILTMKYLIEEL